MSHKTIHLSTCNTAFHDVHLSILVREKIISFSLEYCPQADDGSRKVSWVIKNKTIKGRIKDFAMEQATFKHNTTEPAS